MSDTTKTALSGELHPWTFVTVPDTFTSNSFDSGESFDAGFAAVLHVTVAHITTIAMDAGSALIQLQVKTGTASDDWHPIGGSVAVTNTTANEEIARLVNAIGEDFYTTTISGNFIEYGKMLFIYDEDTPANCELITVDGFDSGATGFITPIGGCANAHNDTTDDSVMDVVDTFAFTVPDGSDEARIVMGANDGDSDLAIRVDFELIQKLVTA